MIEYTDEELHQKKQVKPKPKADTATLAYLEALPWRPFGEDW
jgi:hypothetical protein